MDAIHAGMSGMAARERGGGRRESQLVNVSISSQPWWNPEGRSSYPRINPHVALETEVMFHFASWWP